MCIREFDLEEKYEIMNLLTAKYESDKKQKIFKGIIKKLREDIDAHKLILMKNKFLMR